MNKKKNLLICGNPNPVSRIMIENLMDTHNIFFIAYSKKSQFLKIKDLLRDHVFVNKRSYIHNIMLWIFICLIICKKQKIDTFIAYTDNPIPNGLCILLLKWFFPQINRVFFPYDIISYAVPKEFKYQHKNKIFYFFDRICYEHADKIITKGSDNELKYLEGIYHVYNKPHFPFNFLIEKKHSISKKNVKLDMNNINIVFVGGITKKDDSLAAFNNILKNKNITLHIYSHSLEEIKTNIQSYENLVFHSYVSDHKKFIKEISTYDFGLSYSYSFKEEFLQSKMASGVRIYDYLSAGLPIIIDDKHELMANIIKENNFGIIIPIRDEEHIFSYIKKHDYRKLISSVEKNRKKFFVESNINKLVKFLDQ